VTTFHWGDQQTAYIADGNVANDAQMTGARLIKARVFLGGVLVAAAPANRTIIAFGDSITDGNGSTPDLDRRWPDVLAQRLAPRGIAVVNAGISGARVLSDRMGVNALARFEHDVLGHPGDKTVILLMGINDIGWPGSPFAPTDRPLTADALIAGYRQLIAEARMHQVRIVGATLPPFEGALSGTPFEGHFSPAKDAVRMAVNRWIRTGGGFDAVIDFDALLRDPDRSSRMLPAFDSGDHLHPGDAGYKAMADAIALETLLPSPPRP
jgi:lysophospholipase L1-like esterase